MTFTSETPYIQPKTDVRIYNILKSNRGRWLTATEIAGRLPNNIRRNTRGVGHMMQYISEYPGIEVGYKTRSHGRQYRYVGGATE